jgi:hypothetical protein
MRATSERRKAPTVSKSSMRLSFAGCATARSHNLGGGGEGGGGGAGAHGTRRLQHENVTPTDIFLDLHEDLAYLRRIPPRQQRVQCPAPNWRHVQSESSRRA